MCPEQGGEAEHKIEYVKRHLYMRQATAVGVKYGPSPRGWGYKVVEWDKSRMALRRTRSKRRRRSRLTITLSQKLRTYRKRKIAEAEVAEVKNRRNAGNGSGELSRVSRAGRRKRVSLECS